MPEMPPLDLTWDVMWCRRHLEPYRAEWPTGAAIAMIMLFTEAMKMPAIRDAAGGDVAKLPAALERFKPVCCFVDHQVIADIYAASGVSP